MASPRTLKLPRPLLDALLATSREACPQEVCGLLLGRRTQGLGEVLEAPRLSNQAGLPTGNFAISPRDLFDWEKSARNQELEILGVWHSHPSQGASPSEADHRGTWPLWSNLILGDLSSSEPGIRSFLWQPQGWEEETVQIEDPSTRGMP